MEVHRIADVLQFDSERLRPTLLHNSPRMRVVLFAFQPGQEMAPHTAPSEICFHIVEGEGAVLIGEEEQEVAAGAVVFCPPDVLHGIKARQSMTVLAVIAPSPA